ncbi:MAG: hypothetical protein KAR19_06535 [Bacteroidales bacterium]|nr:hypothetical protein [Bacteroidales bacterium]
MKSKYLIILLFALAFSGCGPSQKITNSWINPEAGSKSPYESIFVIVLSPNKETSFSVEDRMAAIIASRGQKVVLSSAVFPPNLSISENFTREQMAEAIKRTGCDAVFVIALLDVKTVEYYQPGRAYYPMNYGMYGSYYGYYNHYYPQVYSSGYYSNDKTYYIESNFYDLEQDQLLWSIQSEAYNPSSLDSWFDRYSYDLLNELKKEGLIIK